MVEVICLEVEWCLFSPSPLPPAMVADGIRRIGVMGLRGMAPRPLLPIAMGHKVSPSSDQGQEIAPGRLGMWYMGANVGHPLCHCAL